MATYPQTSNILLDVPVHGTAVDVWDQPWNGNANAIDGLTAGVQTIGVSSSNITLTAPAGSVTPSGGPTQAQNAVLKFTGTLTANVTVTLPLPGRVTINNKTSGNFVLIFRASGSGNVIAIQQGAIQDIYNDGTSVEFINMGKIGEYWDYGGASVPAWVAACSVRPYLNCDGSTFSAVTFPTLADILGTTTLPDLRGVSRATLNQGTGRITTAGSGIDGNTRFSFGGSQSITIGQTNLPFYSPIFTGTTTSYASSENLIPVNTGVTGINANFSGPNASFPSLGSISTKINTVVTPAGTIAPLGNSTPLGSMNPVTIAGITLIRAA